MQERRRYIRSDGLVLVNYRVPTLQMQGKTSAYDISATGVRITVDRKLEPPAQVELEIFLPGDSQPILGKGEVVWSEKCKQGADTQVAPEKEYFYAGIKFSVIDERNKNKIISYVRRKIQQP